MNKHLIWAISLMVITAMLCSTIAFINYNSWTIKFEMDNNTRGAIESIEYPIVEGEKNYVNVCRVYNDSTADCGGGAINPDVIQIYGDCKYKWIFVPKSDGGRT